MLFVLITTELEMGFFFYFFFFSGEKKITEAKCESQTLILRGAVCSDENNVKECPRRVIGRCGLYTEPTFIVGAE